MTKYFDPSDDRDRQRGYDDAMAGKPSCSRNAKNVSAYMTGYSEGCEVRAAKIREKRIQNLRRKA